MDAREAEALTGLLPPLLRAYEVLFLLARHFHPPRFANLMAQAGTLDADLKAAVTEAEEGLAHLGDLREALVTASDAALQAFAALREVADGAGDIRGVFRAFRFVPLGLEALYPVAAVLPPVNRFFLDPAMRGNAELQKALVSPRVADNVGLMRFASDDEPSEGERGGFWLYVPENHAHDHPSPLVVALHGGSGTGRQFLWSWLRDARSRGAILAAPSSIGATWALTGEDVDTPNLEAIVEIVRANWSVDPKRILLTGMSDGGTFTYVSGLQEASPFTHLAPVSAAFHPLLAQLIDAVRLQDLPIHIIHGALDWMFPADMAREAERTLKRAGAAVAYREVADLSHTYPREMNAAILDWLG
jgi:phospholipase/carboxylesterase